MAEFDPGPPFETPEGDTISSLALHHRIQSGRIETTNLVSDDDGHIVRVVTTDGEYVLLDDDGG